MQNFLKSTSLTRNTKPASKRGKWTQGLRALIMCVAMLALFMSGTTQSAYTWSGSGTAADPYIVTTAAELDAVRDNLSAHYKLDNDIDLTDYLAPGGEGYAKWGTAGWLPLGVFKATFDGAGHKIKGLWINMPDAGGVGLFVCVSGANTSIKNLSVETDGGKGGVRGKGSVGIIAGSGQSDATFTNCHAIGPVSGISMVGGIVGYASQTGVYDCSNMASVNGSDAIGGIVGYAYGATLTRSYNMGSVSGKMAVGGLVGSHDDVGVGGINLCYNAGKVTGDATVGGLAGYVHEKSHITNCYNVGEVRGNSNVGGLAGFLGGNIFVAGGNDRETSAVLERCYNASVVGKLNGEYEKENFIGNLVGYSYGAYIHNCYYNEDKKFGIPTGVGNSVHKYSWAFWNSDWLRTAFQYAAKGWNWIVDLDNTILDYIGLDSWADWMHVPTHETKPGWATFSDVTWQDAYDATDITNMDYKSNADYVGMSTLTGKLSHLAEDNPGVWFKRADENWCCGYAAFYPELAVFANSSDPIVMQHSKQSAIGRLNDHITDSSTQGYFQSGDGSAANPYIVSTPQQLNHLREHAGEGKYAKQVCDITLSGFTNWQPIGSEASPYIGNYDGGGFTIGGLRIVRNSEDYIGLFGRSRGQISNVNINGCEIYGRSVVGGVVGQSEARIQNCSSSGLVWAMDYCAGGVVGKNSGANVLDCTHISGNVWAQNSHVGGVVGWNSSGNLMNCVNRAGTVYSYGSFPAIGGVVGYNDGADTRQVYRCQNYSDDVNGNYGGSAPRVGGIVGVNWSTVVECVNYGTVVGQTYTGGIAGHNYNSVLNCQNAASGAVTGSGGASGGIVGHNEGGGYKGEVSGCTNLGVVWTGGSNYAVGGIVGNNNIGTIDNCVNGGAVTGAGVGPYVFVGGIAGLSEGSAPRRGLIRGCSNTAQINGVGDMVGGIAGRSGSAGTTYTADIQKSRNTGAVTGKSYVGGVVGGAYEGGNISESYNMAAVSGENYVGGVAGWNGNNIDQCFNYGSVAAIGSNVGGIVGANDLSIANSYNTGAVQGSNIVGGLAGANNANKRIEKSYNAGMISSSGTAGSIIGDNNNSGVYEYCYYSVSVNPGLSAVGMSDTGSSNTATGLASGQMFWQHVLESGRGSMSALADHFTWMANLYYGDEFYPQLTCFESNWESSEVRANSLRSVATSAHPVTVGDIEQPGDYLVGQTPDLVAPSVSYGSENVISQGWQIWTSSGKWPAYTPAALTLAQDGSPLRYAVESTSTVSGSDESAWVYSNEVTLHVSKYSPTLTLTAELLGYPGDPKIKLTATLIGADDVSDQLITFSAGSLSGMFARTSANGVATYIIENPAAGGEYTITAKFNADDLNNEASDTVEGISFDKETYPKPRIYCSDDGSLVYYDDGYVLEFVYGTQYEASGLNGPNEFRLSAQPSVGTGGVYGCQWVSSNPSVAEIAPYNVTRGLVTVKGVGETVISVKAKSDNAFNESPTTSIILRVLPAVQGGGFTIADPGTKTYGDAPFTLSASGGEGTGAVTYSVLPNNVISVTAAGVVTIKGAGTAQVTAVRAASGGNGAATATLNITVDPREISNVSVVVIGGTIYTGSQLTPGIAVSDDATITASDYSISYGQNITVSDGGSISLSGKGNYTGLKSVVFNIGKAMPMPVIFPSPAAMAYDPARTLAQIALSGSGDGMFAWDDDDVIPVPGTSGYLVRFTPNDIANYDYSGINLTDAVMLTMNAPTYALTVSAGTGGTVSDTPTGAYAQNTTIIVSATADDGYHFVGWTINGAVSAGGNTVNPAIFSMPTNAVTVTANFEEDAPVTFALTVYGGRGSGNYAAGAQVTITADAAPDGYVFDKWESSNGGTFANAYSSSTIFAMPAFNVTVTATFQKTQTQLDRETLDDVARIIANATFIVSQANANTQAEVINWLVRQINALIISTGVTVTIYDITLSDFAAASAGTETATSGVNGSFRFTVRLAKGDASLTTPSKNGSITATAFDPTANGAIAQKALTARVVNGRLYVDGLTVGQLWSVYDFSGVLLYQSKASESKAEIPLTARGAYIVISDQAVVKIVY